MRPERLAVAASRPSPLWIEQAEAWPSVRVRLLPGWPNSPSSWTISASGTPSSAATIARALTTISAQAWTSKVPPSRIDRSEWVPPPTSIRRVSPVTSRTADISTWSASATTWTKLVSCPWPVDWVPASTSTAPSSATLTLIRSRVAPTGDST